jgi:hypothetical protein
MPRRITVPDDHVAVILPSQLADELMLTLAAHRRLHLRLARKAGPEIGQHIMSIEQANVCGDVMLALLEAKES